MDLKCRRCGRFVRASAAQYETFERMHYVCFHYEFEHGDTDVDEECEAGGCPSASLAGGRDKVIATARELATEAAGSAPWANATLHQYLEALAAWLRDADGYYVKDHRVPPSNSWQVIEDALRAATTHK